MSRKDYQAIAAVIADTMATIRADVAMGNGPDIEPDAVAMSIGHGIADYFAKDNPHFDRERFMAAADLNDPIPSDAFHV
jgi:hypothetical protein